MTSLLLRCSAQSLRQAPRAGLRRAAAQLWGGALGSRMSLSTRPGAAAAAVEPVQADAPPASAQQAGGPAEPPAFRAFIDFKFVRDNVEAVAANCRNRLSTADPQVVAQLYEEYVKAQQETDRLRAARNENSSAMKVGTPPLPPVLPAGSGRSLLLVDGAGCWLVCPGSYIRPAWDGVTLSASCMQPALSFLPGLLVPQSMSCAHCLLVENVRHATDALL